MKRIDSWIMTGLLWGMTAMPGAGCGAGNVAEWDSDAGVDDVLVKASGCDGNCSASCQCEAGEGDCDANRDCIGALVCPPDGPGIERCEEPAGSCAGQCSPQCPCELGQGDCDRNADCAARPSSLHDPHELFAAER